MIYIVQVWFFAQMKGLDALIRKESLERFLCPQNLSLHPKKKHFCAIRPEKIPQAEYSEKFSADFNTKVLNETLSLDIPIFFFRKKIFFRPQFFEKFFFLATYTFVFNK